MNQQLNIAKGTVGTALEALTSISNTLIKIRSTLTKLADANLSTNQRSQYNTDYQLLISEVRNFVSNAAFNGTNLLETIPGGVSVIANVGGTTFSITSQDLLSAGAIFSGNMVAVQGHLCAAQVIVGPSNFTNLEQTVANLLNSLGGDRRRLDNQINFNAALQKASEEALGFVVDADLAKESARLSSIQIRQQLGTQTLGIANQSPQILLGLFR